MAGTGHPPRLVDERGVDLCRDIAGVGRLRQAIGFGDVERKVLFAVAEADRLPETAYARDVTTQVYALLIDKARRVTGAGHSAIVDAVFADAGERAAIVKAGAGAAFHGLFLTADLATRLSRVGGRKGDASDADAAVARVQEQYDLGDLQWTLVDASGSPEETLRRAKAALGLA